MLANTGQMWFYHAPAKRIEEKQQVPAASQIPGLAALDELDQEAWEREVGVKSQKRAKETDSHYVRLAKQGGRKNLLAFGESKHTPVSEEPQPYPRVEWFDHHETDPDKDKEILSQAPWQPPEYMVHDAVQDVIENKQQTSKKKRAPFHTDDMSVWARPEEENKVKNRRRKFSNHSIKDNTTKLPELTVKPQKPAVMFSKLIGGEYGNEWYREQATHVRKPSKPKNKDLNSSKGYLNMSEYQQSICRKVIPPKKLKPIVFTQAKRDTDKDLDKPMFKLSKFSKIESKLKADMK